MEPNSDQLFEHARARFDHESARRLLREKYQARMLFAHAGGMWRAGPDLITLLHACSHADSVVITDLYDNPVQVSVKEFTALVMQRWQEQMNAWLIEHEHYNKQR
jgi:hypothetical protein